MKPSSRWSTNDCTLQFPIACVNVSNQTQWFVTNFMTNWNNAHANAQSVCVKSGYVFGVPKNGYQNALLQVQALSQYVWINANTDDVEL